MDSSSKTDSASNASADSATGGGKQLTVFQAGRVPYDEAFDVQQTLARNMAETGSDGSGILILLEHPPVITIGRRGSEGNVVASPAVLEREGVQVREVNRGGDVTYHGPGQIVGYPIVNLREYGSDVHEHMRRLERVLIGTLADYGIAGWQQAGYTGVWVEDRKIASIGIAVSRWIAYHGFALNVNPNLDHFKLIVPCGLQDVRMTSMALEADMPVDAHEVRNRIVAHFRNEFEFESVETLQGMPLSP